MANECAKLRMQAYRDAKAVLMRLSGINIEHAQFWIREADKEIEANRANVGIATQCLIRAAWNAGVFSHEEQPTKG